MESLPVASSSNALAIRSQVNASDAQDTQVTLRRGAGLSVYQFSAVAARPIKWGSGQNWLLIPLVPNPSSKISLVTTTSGRRHLMSYTRTRIVCQPAARHYSVTAIDCWSWLGRSPPRSTLNSSTFKVLVTVITRYPGIRNMFRIHKDSKKASAKDLSLKSLWNRPDQSCGEEWNFYRGVRHILRLRDRFGEADRGRATEHA
ncbi:hypothetical protein B0H14DRAFT_849623 [Mycena olivaceomarginata]|nr:hypothetical protein B0H14DRAFT_849623 [Mycena olivaceomarginata]